MKQPKAFRKVVVAAHRDYTLTLVRKDSRREPYYLPYVFHTLEPAQRIADERNAHYRHGQLVVEWVDRPESIGYETTLEL